MNPQPKSSFASFAGNNEVATQAARKPGLLAVSRRRLRDHPELFVLEAADQWYIHAGEFDAAGGGDLFFHDHTPVVGIDDESAQAWIYKVLAAAHG
jgi:hypothetical protein